MTHDETPPRAPQPWSHAWLLVLAITMTACTATLHSDRGPQRPTPTRTAAPHPTVTAKRVPPPSPAIAPSLSPSPSPSISPPPSLPPILSPSPSPSPIPRLAHLDVPEDVEGTDGSTATATAAVDAPTNHTEIPTGGSVTLAHRGDFLVGPARISGRVLGSVLLDTSAGATFIDQRVADDLQLPELLVGSTAMARNAHEASIRELHDLAIGDLGLAVDRAFVADLSGEDGMIGGPLAGVIGLSALGTAPFTIDFATGALTVHTDASFDPPGSVQADALRIDQGLPFVEATLADGTSVWLLLDSGSANGITVWRGFAKQHPGILKSSAPPATAAPTDPTTPPVNTPRTSELRALELLGEHYAHIPVLVQDPPVRPWQRARVVGRVGMAVLRDLRITVHPATERIWVERVRPASDARSE